jgi:hypothetical protein
MGSILVLKIKKDILDCVDDDVSICCNANFCNTTNSIGWYDKDSCVLLFNAY